MWLIFFLLPLLQSFAEFVYKLGVITANHTNHFATSVEIEVTGMNFLLIDLIMLSIYIHPSLLISSIKYNSSILLTGSMPILISVVYE